MAEIPISVIAKLLEYLLDPVVRQGQYLFCVGKITKNLETEKEKLVLAQHGVQKHVEESRNRVEEVDAAVEQWLREVKNHIDELEKLEQQMNTDKGCCQGRCPKWKSYRLCQQMTKKMDTTQKLIERSEFKLFSFPTTIPDIEYFSSGNFMYFQSTKLASDQLLAALQDDDSHMIGLYGMGGSGKTTLVKELGKKAKELKFFDRVLFATVSQTLDVRKIQGEIADLLGLTYAEESEAGRARRLSVRLRSGERILIILDDVWERIKLEDIGIPFEDHHAGCKLLLTTRRQRVCIIMDCKRMVPLNLLSEEESWTLFQKHAGACDISSKGVAQEVARECKGLPIAIAAVGTSLKGKCNDEWKVALRRLRDSKPIDAEPGVRDAFTCLQLSYDYFKSKEAKSLFLMCCMFPEGHDILVEDLFRIGVGLGLYGEMDSFETMRNEVNACIDNLIDSCLLTHSEIRKDHLTMHDMVRDVALWIASKERRNIVVNALAKDVAMKDCYAFTSWWNRTCNIIDYIPQQLDAPKIEILQIRSMNSYKLSKAFFKNMKALKVLAMVNHDCRPFLSPLQSMQWLTNLQTLRLQYWRFNDMSWVVGLRRLQILDLQHSSIQELPNGLEELNKLKLLDLSHCEIRGQCFKVIRRCTQLEELYAFSGERGYCTFQPNECSLSNVSFPRLQRYVLEIVQSTRDKVYYDSKDLNSRILYLEDINISASDSFTKYLLQRAEDVFLFGLDGDFKNIVPDVVRAVGGMNELTSLWLECCSDLKCLIDKTCRSIDSSQAEASFPNLIKLTLRSMDNLKEVCRGPPPLCFLEKLQELEIGRCYRLQSIFPRQMTLANLKILRITDCTTLASLFMMSIAKTMKLLEELTIKNCDQLKNIIGEDGIGTSLEIIPVPNSCCVVFPQLRFLTIISCHNLECVFPNSCIQSLQQLEEVHIWNASQLKYVFGEHECEHNEIQIELPLLKSLRLENLKNLLRVFPKNYHPACPSLSRMRWVECPKFSSSIVNIKVNSDMNMMSPSQWNLEVSAPLPAVLVNVKKLEVSNCEVVNIFQVPNGVGVTVDQPELMELRLESLTLTCLPRLRYIWTGPPQILSLQYLQQLSVEGCNKLKSICSMVIHGSLPVLRSLSLVRCEDLEEIVAEDKECEILSNAPQIFFPELLDLQVEGYNKLRCLFSASMSRMLPQLSTICVSDSANLEELFRQKSEASTSNENEIVLPNLSHIELRDLPSLVDICKGFKFHAMNLRKMEMSGCPKLKYIFSSVVHGSLQELESVTISECEQLEEIVAEFEEPQHLSNTQMCFPKLRTLKVMRCNKLKMLFGGKSEEGTVSGVEIVFADLRTIKLVELPSLTEVCKGLKLRAVNLRSVIIYECPNLDFSLGATEEILPNIEEQWSLFGNGHGSQIFAGGPTLLQATLDVDFVDIKNCGVVNIFNFQGIGVGESQQEVLTLQLRLLELENVGELRFIWAGLTATQVLNLEYLKYVRLSQCEKLKSIFINGCLTSLESLMICECEELGEIIEHNEQPHQNPMDAQVFLPRLREIEVKRCNKLKCLFSVTFSKMLPRLKSLCVSEAAQLREVFGHQSEEGPTPSNTQDNDIVLPNLESIELAKLPVLVEFCRGFKLQAAKLHKVIISDCPNFFCSTQEMLKKCLIS